MSGFLLYLLESSAILALLYLLYLVLLRKETFFTVNRFFLLSILALSLFIPLLSFDVSAIKSSPIHAPVEKLSEMRRSYYQALDAWTYDQTNVPPALTDPGASISQKKKWGNLIAKAILLIYGAGLIVVAGRLLWVYSWLYRLKRSNPKEEIAGITVVKVAYPIAPFSFMNSVFVHSEKRDSHEFVQILEHEKTHVRQRHSFDLLFVQLFGVFLWFNPTVWLLIKSLKETHEYIADKNMINRGYSLVEYQTLLLSQLVSNHSNGLVHNFNLSFIKKRITMMKIEKSGWAGWAKAALVLVTVVGLSLVIVRCNSRIDEQVTLESASSVAEFNNKIELPVLPKTGFHFEGELDDALHVSVWKDDIFLNGKKVTLDELGALAKNKSTAKSVVVMRIDQAQSMELVRDVHWQLRKADRRKLLCLGQTSGGEPVEMRYLLPPAPGSHPEISHVVLDDKYIAEHDISLLKVDLGKGDGASYQDKVYSFVKDQVDKGRSNYVVSARFDDQDTYGSYLSNLVYLQEGFNQIYEERAQAMFGKSFWALNREGEDLSEYYAVRKDIPMAISIAED